MLIRRSSDPDALDHRLTWCPFVPHEDEEEHDATVMIAMSHGCEVRKGREGKGGEWEWESCGSRREKWEGISLSHGPICLYPILFMDVRTVRCAFI